MQPDSINELQNAIRAMHGCDSHHVESVAVVERFEGKIAWQGTVEVFDLVAHPRAKRAYAWTYRDEDHVRSIAVLEIPPIDSAHSAVKVAIASKAKR